MPADLHDDMIDPAVANHLRHTLRRVALTTPLDGAPAPAVAARRPHRRALLAVATLATAGCVTAGLLVVSNGSENEQQDQTPPAVAAPPTAVPGSGPLLQVDLPWQPMGVDATMKPVDEPPVELSAMFDPARFTDDSEWRPIGSPAYFDIPGLGVQAVYRAQFAANARASGQERTCVTTAQPATATDPGAGLSWLCAAVPNEWGDVGVGDVQLLSLPPDVAFVTFAAGSQARWLRPVGGVAVLASSDGIGFHHLWTADGYPSEHQSAATVDLRPPLGQPLDVRFVDTASDEAQPILDSLRDAGTRMDSPLNVRPGSLHIFSIAENETIVVWQSMLADDTVIPTACSATPSDAGAFESFGCGGGFDLMSSTVDLQSAAGRRTYLLWSDLGPEIDHAIFTANGEAMWTPAFDGWLIVASGVDADLTLVTVDGGEIDVDPSKQRSLALAGPAGLFPNGTPAEGVEPTWGSAFSLTLNGCVLAAGADPSTGAYDGSEPADTLWARCVTQAVAAWRVAIAEVAAAVEPGGTPTATLAPEAAVTEIAVTEVARSESPPNDVAVATEAPGSRASTPRPTNVAITELPSNTTAVANASG